MPLRFFIACSDFRDFLHRYYSPSVAAGMATRVCRTGRVTGLERTEPETGGMTVGRALTVATAVAARIAAGRSEAARAAATVVVLRLVMLGPMVFGLLFLMVVMVMMVGPMWFLVTAE